MKVFRLFIIFLFVSLSCYAKDVTLIVTGEGNNQAEAIRDALSNAVGQAYGNFISAKTTIFNDELVCDEVINLKKGNIKKYKILSESTGSTTQTTLEVRVSLDKLLKFSQNKGSECELAGTVFAENLKLDKLNHENARKAMEHLCTTMAQLAPKMYDYNLRVGEPVLDGTIVYVPIAVDCILNKNGESFYDISYNTMSAIRRSLSNSGLNGNYKSTDKDMIDSYWDYIYAMPRLWCSGFCLYDNMGNRVEPVLLLDTNNEKPLPYCSTWPIDKRQHFKADRGARWDDRPADDSKNIVARGVVQRGTQGGDLIFRIDVQFKSKGVEVLRFGQSKTSKSVNQHSVYNVPYFSHIKSEAVRYNGDSGFGSDHSGMVFTLHTLGNDFLTMPYNSIRHEREQDPARFSSSSNAGQICATAHIVLLYNVKQIENLSKISISSII